MIFFDHFFLKSNNNIYKITSTVETCYMWIKIQCERESVCCKKRKRLKLLDNGSAFFFGTGLKCVTRASLCDRPIHVSISDMHQDIKCYNKVIFNFKKKTIFKPNNVDQ